MGGRYSHGAKRGAKLRLLNFAQLDMNGRN